MRTVVIFTFLLCTFGMLGCKSENIKTSYMQTVSDKKPFDAMPREGWATDPNLSYRLYSYYPYDFRNGGFYQPYLHPFSRMQ